MTGQILDNFVLSYLATAEWLAPEGEAHNGFTLSAKRLARIECEDFLIAMANVFTLKEYTDIVTYQSEGSVLAGHDFWLTRNHHGAGFWDKDIYDELAVDGCDRLTKLSHTFKQRDIYVYRKKLNFY